MGIHGDMRFKEKVVKEIGTIGVEFDTSLDAKMHSMLMMTVRH